ncbi:MAG: hypothetical protein GC164_03550 [Phycisphaera sp.]|nr:hypothetical protein [Phycisphaera sp.]
MSKIHKRGSKTPEMNMTPMIDVTFQLIIFFMLVNNIVSSENVQLIPPDLSNPKTVLFEDENRIVVNVAPKIDEDFKSRQQGNPLNYPGEATGVVLFGKEYQYDQLDQITAILKDSAERSPKDKDGKPTVSVLLRADAALYYTEVQPVMAAIANAGITTVHLVALMPEDKR